MSPARRRNCIDLVRRASVVSPNDVLAGFYSNIIDDFNGECLAIRVERKLNSADVIDAPTGLFIIRGFPTRIHSNNGPEFIAESGQAMDQGRRRKGRLYQIWGTLGERLLRELQRSF